MQVFKAIAEKIVENLVEKKNFFNHIEPLRKLMQNYKLNFHANFLVQSTFWSVGEIGLNAYAG